MKLSYNETIVNIFEHMSKKLKDKNSCKIVLFREFSKFEIKMRNSIAVKYIEHPNVKEYMKNLHISMKKINWSYNT